MVKKLILHVGIHKTGSTALQRRLFNSRTRLLESGVRYLSECSNHSIPIYSMFCDEPEKYPPNIAIGIDTKDKIKEYNRNTQLRISKELENNECAITIISGEDISSLKVEAVTSLKRFLDKFFDEISVLAYVREPYSFISSFANEGLKSKWTLEGLYKSPPKMQIRWRLEKFFEIFDKVDVRMFQRDFDKSWNIIDDFLHYLKIPIKLEESSLSDNASVSILAAKTLDSLNKRYPYWVDGSYNKDRGKNTARFLSKIKGKKFIFDSAIYKSIHTDGLADIKWLIEKTGLDLLEKHVDSEAYVDHLSIPSGIVDSIVDIVNDLTLRWERNILQ